MPMVVSSWQHCNEQQFQTLSCIHYTIFLVVLSRFIHTSIVTIDHIIALKKLRVRLAYILLNVGYRQCQSLALKESFSTMGILKIE